ncbi:Cytochrome 82A3 [Capsicum annuum]|uniref:cytochrome P450 CYP82D47 n=1 Tax=Capsicum annuum TaxID=4072 RepID=UPI001FB0CCB0|nr:cytochrome P450 CYP82D47 [Capsicum annuum]KAF3670209.1 Cytochrome 82A3 [Capsicum annuum]KAF3673617.1 Cytochrome 82A3 [Capsicum annuum]
MDFLLIALTLAFSFFLFLFLHKLSISSAKRQSRNVPKADRAWPIIGHLHLLNGPQMPHEVFGHMAEKYGPIFQLKLGVNQVVVVSDHNIVKECFTTNDMAFANRPKTLALEILGYNYAMFAFAPYGSYWREIRKIGTIELLSARRIEMFSHIREFEVKSAVKEIYDKGNNLNGVVKMEMKEWFGNLIMNIMMKILFGVQYKGDDEEEKRRAQKATRRSFELLGAFVVADFLPYLRWLDTGGHEKALKETAKEIDCLGEEWLVEHKRKRKLRVNRSGDEEDFMDVMLSICEDKDLPGHFDADTIIKATCMSMLLASVDTTMVTLTWTLSLLLNNYQSLKKAQDELDTHVGKNRWVQESDIKNLVYLQAIVNESMCLYPPTPILLPHESIEDCVVSGYDIPKGTRLFVNMWKFHHDPNIWPNPHEFKPERFLTTHKDVNVRGNHFELIPFGTGRRMCPGTSLALQVVYYVLAVLLQRFDIKRPSDEPIDMSESFGLTNLKASPLEVHLTPRLNSNLYE